MRKEISACGTDGFRFREKFCTSEGTCARTRKPFRGTETRLYSTNGSSYLQENILTRKYNSCPYKVGLLAVCCVPCYTQDVMKNLAALLCRLFVIGILTAPLYATDKPSELSDTDAVDTGKMILYIDGQRISAFLAKRQGTIRRISKNHFSLRGLAPGFHTAEAKTFGWETAPVEFFVSGTDTGTSNAADVHFHFERSLFSLFSFYASVYRFNPHDRLCSFVFSVSAPGDGVIEIYDERRIAVRRIQLKPFTGWQQNCVWDGKDDSGRTVKEGVYTVVLKVQPHEQWQDVRPAADDRLPRSLPPAALGAGSAAIAQDNAPVLSAHIQVSVDFSAFGAFAPSGMAGISSGPVPTARLMERNASHSFVSAGIDVPPGGAPVSVPLFLSYSRVPFKKNTELSLAGTIVFTEQRKTRAIAGISLKAGSHFGRLHYAGIIRYAFGTEDTGTFSEAGLGTGALAELSFSRGFIGLSEEAVFGHRSGILVPFEGAFKTGLAGGITAGNFSLRLSAAVFSPFDAHSVKPFERISCAADIIAARIAHGSLCFVPIVSTGYTYTGSGSHTISARAGVAFVF